MVDTVGTQLVAKLLESAAHLRPREDDFATLSPEKENTKVCGLMVQFGPGQLEPITRTWLFDGENRVPTTAHGRLHKALWMAKPQEAAQALQQHLLATAPLVVANGLYINWVVGPNTQDGFEIRFHNRNRTMFAHTAEQAADSCGGVFHHLSGLAHGTRIFSIEPKSGTGTRTVVAGNPIDAAKYWMLMESLDTLRVRSVQPPAWVVEKHAMDDMDAELRAFGDGLPDLRIVQRR